MENVLLLDRQSSASFDFETMMSVGRCRRRGNNDRSAPALRSPMIYSLPLLPSSNQPPLLPLPPKYATFFPCLPAAAPPLPTTTVPAAARDRRRRRRPPPTWTTKAMQKKKPLERATPLPPAPVVSEALDDLEQEVARHLVQDLLHALAPPPSSLPLPSFSLMARASPVEAAILRL